MSAARQVPLPLSETAIEAEATAQRPFENAGTGLQIAFASFETRSFGPLLRMRNVVCGIHKPPHAEERANARVSKHAEHFPRARRHAQTVAQALCMGTEDFARAFRAFAAKQKPVFEGN